eukprot:764073-Hanusia_phi.AAC.1
MKRRSLEEGEGRREEGGGRREKLRISLLLWSRRSTWQGRRCAARASGSLCEEKKREEDKREKKKMRERSRQQKM